jgi:hypothetical protein
MTCDEIGDETMLRHLLAPVFNLVSWLVGDPAHAADVMEAVVRKALRNAGP